MVSQTLRSSLRQAALAASLVILPLSASAENLANLAKLANLTEGADTPAVSVFGISGRLVGEAERLPQWAQMFERMQDDHVTFAACVEDEARCTTQQARDWRGMLMTARGKPQSEQLRIVNTFFNRMPYRSDAELYGRSEYWASPSEFMARSGDCEDYSIAKYLALRQLGFASERMRLVAVMDTIRGIGHAVLTIKVDGRALVLDSLSDGIFADTDYAHYVPRHSVSENGFWLHATSRQIADAQARRANRLAARL